MARETSPCPACDARLERTLAPGEPWRVGAWPVWLKFASDDERQRFLDVQVPLPDGELVGDERGVRYLLNAENRDFAIRRANTLRDGFCHEAHIDRNHVEVWRSPPRSA
jgi:hypothetical protein